MWPTIEGAEILAVGDDLKVPAGDYRVLPPGDVSDLGDGRAIFEELVAAHGAVVFQLVPRARSQLARAALEAHYRAALVAHHCDALAATTREEVHAILARSLGAPESESDVIAWLASRPLPREIVITIPKALGPDAEWVWQPFQPERITRWSVPLR